MYTDLFLRVSSHTLSTAMGGFAIFFLYYTGKVTNPDVAWQLFGNALILGGFATAIVYCRNKWLN
jgi:hypothetical protein